jgi:hypothetical protein
LFDPSQLGPQGPPSAPQAQGGGDGVALLKQAIDTIRQYQGGEKDEEDLLTAEKITTLIQQLLAKQQKELDGLLQGKADPAALRGALGG